MGNEGSTMSKRLLIILTLFSAFVIYCLITNVFDFSIFNHIILSLNRMMIGYILAIIIGNAFAIFLSSSKYLSMAFKPLIAFLMSIPTITWVPVLLIITGISDKTIITAIFLGSFFTVVYNTLDGLENVEKNLIRVGKMLEYGRMKLLFKVSIPSSFNHMLVGMKMGISYSWRALVGAEMLGAAQTGLGYLLFTSRQFYNLNRAFSTLFIIGFLGYILSRIIIMLIENNTINKWGMSSDYV